MSQPTCVHCEGVTTRENRHGEARDHRDMAECVHELVRVVARLERRIEELESTVAWHSELIQKWEGK